MVIDTVFIEQNINDYDYDYDYDYYFSTGLPVSLALQSLEVRVSLFYFTPTHLFMTLRIPNPETCEM